MEIGKFRLIFYNFCYHFSGQHVCRTETTLLVTIFCNFPLPSTFYCSPCPTAAPGSLCLITTNKYVEWMLLLSKSDKSLIKNTLRLDWFLNKVWASKVQRRIKCHHRHIHAFKSVQRHKSKTGRFIKGYGWDCRQVIFVTLQSYQRGMVLKRILHHHRVGYSKLVRQKQLRKALLLVFTCR